ncbi:MAG: hypothetical protein ACTHLD_17195 [Chitinophaga sp.]
MPVIHFQNSPTNLPQKNKFSYTSICMVVFPQKTALAPWLLTGFVEKSTLFAETATQQKIFVFYPELFTKCCGLYRLYVYFVDNRKEFFKRPTAGNNP